VTKEYIPAKKHYNKTVTTIYRYHKQLIMHAAGNQQASAFYGF
jgi:hypothetical protein